MKSEDFSLHPLEAISPIDGRYHSITKPLSKWLSEYSLFKYRVYVEVEYLIALSEWKGFVALPEFATDVKRQIRRIAGDFSLQDAQLIQNIERFGHGGKKPIHHDVKAAEYFVRKKLKLNNLEDQMEMVHFGLTSEDVNNIAYNIMIKGVLDNEYIPKLVSLLDNLCLIAEKEKRTVMLGRTHGQPASPTTFGKEIANYLERFRKEVLCLKQIKLPAKLNGAVGNYNAQVFAMPEVNWLDFTENFIQEIGFEVNLLTTQIEPHDGISELFSHMILINNILRDLCVDLWLYTSMNYLLQKKNPHEVGSSTMPHKINPWRLENAEGNTVEANARFTSFINKLQNSRLQRDLSDHAAQRSMGAAIAQSYIAICGVNEELGRLKPDRDKMLYDLSRNGAILTEAVQTLLRKEGRNNPYELMKDFSRGNECTVEDLHRFVGGLDIDQEIIERIRSLRPEDYIGFAPELAEIAVSRWKEIRDDTRKIT